MQGDSEAWLQAIRQHKRDSRCLVLTSECADTPFAAKPACGLACAPARTLSLARSGDDPTSAPPERRGPRVHQGGHAADHQGGHAADRSGSAVSVNGEHDALPAGSMGLQTLSPSIVLAGMLSRGRRCCAPALCRGGQGARLQPVAPQALVVRLEPARMHQCKHAVCAAWERAGRAHAQRRPPA